MRPHRRRWRPGGGAAAVLRAAPAKPARPPAWAGGRAGALCAPAGLSPAAPILPGQARYPRGVCPPIQHTSGGSTNGGSGCRPPPAPDAGAIPKARVPRIGGPGESGLRDLGGTDVEPWSRRERHPAILWFLSDRSERNSPPQRRNLCFVLGDIPPAGGLLSREGK